MLTLNLKTVTVKPKFLLQNKGASAYIEKSKARIAQYEEEVRQSFTSC